MAFLQRRVAYNIQKEQKRILLDETRKIWLGGTIE